MPASLRDLARQEIDEKIAAAFLLPALLINENAAPRNYPRFLKPIRAHKIDVARIQKVNTQTEMLRVLCVDDEVHVLSMVADTLRGQGHEVQTAVDGAHALQKIATAEPPYHLLIVDGRMPNLDGWGLILQARTGGYTGRGIFFFAFLRGGERERFRHI